MNEKEVRVILRQVYIKSFSEEDTSLYIEEYVNQMKEHRGKLFHIYDAETGTNVPVILNDEIYYEYKIIQASTISTSEEKFETPMLAMMHYSIHSINAGGYAAISQIMCYRYVNGEQKERQWTITID
jgi:hypothetical protein